MNKVLNIRNVVTSHREPGFNYGYVNSPFIEFDYARNATFLVYNGRLMPISFEDQKKEEYKEGIQCHFCINKFTDEDRKRFEERQKQINKLKVKNQNFSNK